MAKKPFRTEESFAFEGVVRERIRPFLEKRGFQVSSDERTRHGTATSQVVTANSINGRRYKMRVRLCWRRDGRNPRELLYSAAQLRARLIDGDWDKTVQNVANRGKSEGVSDSLFVQANSDGIQLAAIVPNDQLLAIWKEQRRISADLIDKGLMGRISKNHAENGSSPTIWLQDERTPVGHRVSDALWNWPGVVNVPAIPVTGLVDLHDDAIDDLGVLPLVFPGRDSGEQHYRMVSGWKRDRKVRNEVRARAQGRCERSGCNEGRDYIEFLDVHHILGIWASDRPWTCVALCPNCHREAHFSPNREELNSEFARYAAKFIPQ